MRLAKWKVLLLFAMASSLQHEEELASVMEIGVNQPVNRGCYPLGASIPPYPEITLYVEDKGVTRAIISTLALLCSDGTGDCGGWLQLCSVLNEQSLCGSKVYLPNVEADLALDGFSVVGQLAAPPTILLQTSGCHQLRFELIGGVYGQGNNNPYEKKLLRSSNDVVFQVTALFECVPSPLCPATGNVFSGEGVSQFHPVTLKSEEKSHQLMSHGFEAMSSRMSLASDSPKHHDVIFSSSILLEVSRRDDNGEQRSVEEMLIAQQGLGDGLTNQLQLCLGLMLSGEAAVSEDMVEVTKSDHTATSGCLSLEENSWRAVLTPPGSNNHRTCSTVTLETTPLLYDKCIVLELVGDGVMDFVNISVPFFLHAYKKSAERGLVVGVQVWLEQIRKDDTSHSWSRILSSKPKEVVLMPGVKSSGCVITTEELTASIEIGEPLFEQDEMVLVMCRWSEDIEWLRHQPFRVIIYEKKPREDSQQAKHAVSRNIGGEATAFLKFIIDYYDYLPTSMLFLHSHRWAYHQEDIAILLANLPRNTSESSTKYCNINRVAWGHNEDQEQCWLKHHWNNSCQLHEDKGEGGWLKKWLGDIPDPLWANLTSPHWKGPHLVERCCAQFIVSRELIRSRPLGFYRHLLAQIYARVSDNDSIKTGSSRHWGLLLEWLWHVIFSQPASMLPHDPSLQHSFEALGPQGVLAADRVMLDRAQCVTRKRKWVLTEEAHR